MKIVDLEHPLRFEKRSPRVGLSFSLGSSNTLIRRFLTMSDANFSPDADSRGGLAVVAVVFMSLAFLVTLGVQFAWSRFASLPSTKNLAAVSDDQIIQPKPSLSPDQVVELQLQDLSNANSAHGIMQCFAFASPGNKQSTGPLTRFAAMLERPPYDVLLHRHLLLIGKPAIIGEEATVMVTLLDERDQIRVFHFHLTKQHGEAIEGCWMTDAVYPLQQMTSPARLGEPTVWRSPQIEGMLLLVRGQDG